MSPHTHIFLTGFMGCGKSTVGPLLAEQTGRAFLDLDEVIEEREGMTISDLFRLQGEQAFREAETRALVAIPSGMQVVGLGGGAFLSEENRRIIRSRGCSVWLDVPISELLARIRRSSRPRPILREHGQLLPPQRLEERVRGLLADRRAAYAEADIRLEVEAGSTIEENVRRLRARLEDVVL